MALRELGGDSDVSESGHSFQRISFARGVVDYSHSISAIARNKLYTTILNLGGGSVLLPADQNSARTTIQSVDLSS